MHHSNINTANNTAKSDKVYSIITQNTQHNNTEYTTNNTEYSTKLHRIHNKITQNAQQNNRECTT